MAEPFIGEIRIVPYTFTPYGYVDCFGGYLNIAQYTMLYAVIGTYYGGNGVSTLGVPDFRGRTPIHQGTGPGLTYRPIGYAGGGPLAELSYLNLPSHTHTINLIRSASSTTQPQNEYLGNAKLFNTPTKVYTAEVDNLVEMSSNALSSYGSGTTEYHENMQPYQVFRYVLATDGIFPARN